ncbi:MAG: peptide ABC transporter substrate-binding protein [Actinomycetota bacterium]
MKKLLALIFALALIAAACGSDGDDEAGSDDNTSAESDDSSGDEEAEDAMEDEEDEAMEEEDAMADGEAGTGGDLLLLQWQAPSQANVLLSSGTKDALAASLVIEPLAKFDPNGQIVPTLAAEIPTVENGGVAADFTSITWNLKQDVLWSDGTPFTSDDVLFTYEYCLDEATGCGADLSKVDSVTADDDFTVTVAFTEALPFPYQHFVGYLFPVIQRAQMAECIGAAAAGCSEQNFAPVGTGPYTVTELRPEDTVTYEWNPNYRGVSEGMPSFGNVTIKGGGDAEASARSVLEIGEADYGWNLQVAPEILQPMEAAGNGRIVTSFTASVEHINLNQTDPDADPPSEVSNPHPILFDNPEFARALSLAIDRDALVQIGYGPTGVPICVMWPVGDQQSTNQDWCKTRDVDQAIEILEGLGYTDTDGDGIRETPEGLKLEFDYLTSTNAVRQSNQDIVKANWEEIGVAVNMGNEDASLFFDGTCASDACIWKFFTDMEMFTNGATLPDPVAYLGGWRQVEIPTPENAWGLSNMPRMQSDEYDALWDEVSALSPSDPSYNGLVQQLQDIQVETGAVIPLIHRGSVSAISNTIDGFGEPNGWDSEYWNIEQWTRAE